MTDYDFELLGQMADSMDNVLAAAELPFPDKMHKEQLVRKIKEWSEKLKAFYEEVTGENPWEE